MSSHKSVLGQIALSLSGGGYRAAAFHLGTLDMLNELGLLQDVTVLSTVSGGSIAGASFAASVADGTSFKDFREQLHAFMRDTNVITRGLARLEDSTNINGIVAMPSLIRAAADVYASDGLLGNRTIDSLRNDASHISEIVINATDFHTGNSFRFQTSSNPNIRSGNNNSPIPPEVNVMIRAADAVAASACFPSGFEPLRFPGDFQWVDGQFDIKFVRKMLGPKFSEEVPLMDGGVFDNQGIDSIKNICDRKRADIGVYIISDTSQRSGNLLDSPVRERHGKVSLRVWYWLIVLLALGSLATMLAALWDFITLFGNGQLTHYRGVVSQLIPFLLSAAVLVLVLYGRRRFKKAAAEVREKTGIGLWNSLKVLTIPELTELVGSRLRSVLVMTSSVFMRHLRALAFESIFADPNMTEKLIPNLIYDMDNESRWGDEIKNLDLAPSDQLRDLACRAESYETNLWFLDQKDLDTLIACGRATMCFKILKYLLKQKAVEIAGQATPECDLYLRVKQLWLQLNPTPPAKPEMSEPKPAQQ
jgi:predicted acylesterase/phospholipase RssA